MDAQTLRLKVLEMARTAGSGHLGGSFSCAEILATLYDDFLRVDPSRPDWEMRDRLILSKGHAAPMLYAALAARGFFAESELTSLRDFGSPLQGHPCMFKLPGVDMSTGSLGLGLSAGVGMALALRESCDARVYVVMGDGEWQEGQNWEAVSALAGWNLSNVTPIIDINGVQLDGTLEEVQPNQTPIADRVRAFGLTVFECAGHDRGSLRAAVQGAIGCDKPHAVVARTVKGKGVSFMEGKNIWHGKSLTQEEYLAARAELTGGMSCE